jgi:uncharacterized membrane protein required for colicin V production
MTIYDAAMAVVLIGGMIRGAWRGITWQLASIGSLVLGYLFAYPISAQIAPLLPGPAEATRALSMAAAYAIVSGGVFFAAWMVRGTIHKLKFDAYDRHLGMMLGGVEGVGVGILFTLLIVSVSPSTREPIFSSPSGKVVGSVMNSIGPVLPGEVRRILQPFWNAAQGTDSEDVALDGSAAQAPQPEAVASTPEPTVAPAAAPTPAPAAVAASVIPAPAPVGKRDGAVRPTAARVDALPALDAPKQPAPASAQSVLDAIVDKGKQTVEQVVAESLDTDPDQKAASLRELVEKDKKRGQAERGQAGPGADRTGSRARQPASRPGRQGSAEARTEDRRYNRQDDRPAARQARRPGTRPGEVP